MRKKSTIKYYFQNPSKLLFRIGRSSFLRLLSDEQYIKLLFRCNLGYKLDLENPRTFDEKLNWLKLHDRNPLYPKLVDKYEAKLYVASIIGDNYIIPTLGVYDKFVDINFDALPEKFVLKCTHDSGGLVICRDKSTLDIKSARKKIDRSLRRNYYNLGREWPYKDVKPRIIAEKYMTDSDDSDEFTDYKFYCFNGKADCVLVCLDRAIGDTKFYFFDEQWNLKRYNKRGKEAPKDFTIPKPDCMDEMFRIAGKLSENIPAVRVDLFQSNGQIYFGEMTLYPASGFDPNRLPEANLYFGNKIDLATAYDNRIMNNKEIS